MRILNVVHKGLRRLIEDDDGAGLPASAVPKLRKIISFLQDMGDEEELRTVPTWKAHQMTGDSMSVTSGMRLKNPAHPGGFVKTEVIAPLALSVTDAARVLGVTRAALSALLNERASLSPEMAVRLEKAFGVSMETLMRMQGSFDIARARGRAPDIAVTRYVPAG